MPTVIQSVAANKPSANPKRGREPDTIGEAVPTAAPSPEVSNLALWRVLAGSKLNADARQIVNVGRALLELVSAFLDNHDEDGYATALTDAGLGEYVNAHHRQVGTDIFADLRGLQWALDLGIGIVEGETYPSVPSVEELEEEIRNLKPR